jgi:hypothetical protein
MLVRLCRSPRTTDGVHEIAEFPFVELAVSAESAAHVDRKRLHELDCTFDVRRIETSGEIYRDANRVADLTADRPVVRAPCSAELANGSLRIARIKEYRVACIGGGDGTLDCAIVAHVDHLHDCDAGQRGGKLLANGRWELVVDKLKRVRSTKALLFYDPRRTRLGRKKKRPDAGWNDACDASDSFLRYRTGPARHARDKSNGRRTVAHSQRCFLVG